MIAHQSRESTFTFYAKQNPSQDLNGSFFQRREPLKMGVFKSTDFQATTTLSKETNFKTFVGIHKPTGKKYAIKKIQKGSIDRASLYRQAEIHMRLKHENILEVYDLIESNQSYYFVMEHVEYFAADVITVDDFISR